MAEPSRGFLRRAVSGAGLVLMSCLPGDTRPVPGSLTVTVTGNPPLLGGGQSTLTVDGWTVSYEKFLLSIGGTSLDDDTSCANYYDADYRRLVNMRISGSQKLSVAYGLGHCDFGFRVAGPNADAVLGDSVTAADKALMGTPAMDPYTTDRYGTPAPTGIALYAKGSATKGALTKTFTLTFRQRLVYEKCAAGNVPDGGREGVDLKSGTAGALDLAVRGETLFLDSTDLAHGELRFDVLAAADDQYGNRDGDVALSELGQVLLTDIGSAAPEGSPLSVGSYAQSPEDLYRGGMGGPTWSSLEDFVYLGLFPNVVRFAGNGTCLVRTRPRP